jgi:hypothetical protein
MLVRFPIGFDDVQIIRANAKDEVERNNIDYRKTLEQKPEYGECQGERHCDRYNASERDRHGTHLESRHADYKYERSKSKRSIAYYDLTNFLPSDGVLDVDNLQAFARRGFEIRK